MPDTENSNPRTANTTAHTGAVFCYTGPIPIGAQRMAVDSLHPQYSEFIRLWQRNIDAVEGERAIKHRLDAYLPIPDPDNNKSTKAPRYQSYLQRAVYTNFTGRTVRALTGAVFRISPQIELPDQMKYIIQAADAQGLTLETIAHKAVRDVLTVGRYVVMADYPEAPQNATQEDSAALHAYIACYPATALLNWHETNGKLDLAVLRERIEEPNDDGFTYDTVDYYRVLRLVDGKATIRLYRNAEQYGEEITLMANGAPLTDLPLVIIGSEDNNPEPDQSPIADIVNLNIAHYQSSADRREGSYLTGQPMFSINTGEDSSQQWMENNPSFSVGSRQAVVTKGGGISLVQAEANNASLEDMRWCEDQMVRLGAQIINDAKGQETAEAARMRSSAETSTLNTVVRNVSEAFTKVLEWCAQYEGVTNMDDIDMKLNEQFFADDVDAQVMAQVIMGVDRGFWPKQVPREYARRAGLISPDMTDEDLDSMSEEASPMTGGGFATQQ